MQINPSFVSTDAPLEGHEDLVQIWYLHDDLDETSAFDQTATYAYEGTGNSERSDSPLR